MYRRAVLDDYQPGTFETVVNKCVAKFGDKLYLKDLKPVIAFVHPAELKAVPLSVIISQGITLPVVGDERIARLKVRVASAPVEE